MAARNSRRPNFCPFYVSAIFQMVVTICNAVPLSCPDEHFDLENPLLFNLCLKIELTNLRNEMTNMKYQITSLEADGTSRNEQINEIVEDDTARDTKINVLDVDGKARNERINKIVEDDTARDTRISALEVNGSTRNEKIDKIVEDDTTRDIKISALDVDGKARNKRINKIVEDDTARDTRISALEERRCESGTVNYPGIQDKNTDKYVPVTFKREFTTAPNVQLAGRWMEAEGRGLGYVMESQQITTTGFTTRFLIFGGSNFSRFFLYATWMACS